MERVQEFVIDSARVVVSADAIDRVVEAPLTRLPLSTPWIAGLACFGGLKMLVVDVARKRGRPERSRARCAILKSGAGPFLTTAILLDTLGGIGEAGRQTTASQVHAHSPVWIGSANMADGSLVAYLDIEQMLAWFGIEDAAPTSQCRALAG